VKEMTHLTGGSELDMNVIPDLQQETTQKDLNFHFILI
jgi:hypothetical protein